MNYKNCFLISLLSIGSFCYSQEKITEHIVGTGETVTSIAKLYNVKIDAIYKLNPEAKKGINIRSVLLIPSQLKIDIEKTETKVNKTHVVLPKETVYGIARQYGIKLQDLYKNNPELKDKDLKEGQEILLPENILNTDKQPQITQESTKKTVSENPRVLDNKQQASHLDPKPTGNEIVYEVQPKESKYSIAKKNGITVLELEKANPILEKEELKIGQKILVPLKSTTNLNQVTARAETKDTISPKEKIHETIKIVNSDNIKVGTSVVLRKVRPKETKYSIAKEYGIPVTELERQNPQIVDKFHVGYELSIRKIKISDPTVVENQMIEVEKTPDPVDDTIATPVIYNSDFRDKLVATASEYIGVRYQSGGASSEGFDCSGLVRTTFENLNINLPRTSLEQSQYGIVIDNNQAEKGDLIFFRTNGSSNINHVGMIVEVSKDDIKFIHASSSSGVMISSLNERYYIKRFSQINRVLQ